MTYLLRNNQVTGILLHIDWTARKADPGRPGSLLPAVLAPSLPPAGPAPKIRRKGTAPPRTNEGDPLGRPPHRTEDQETMARGYPSARTEAT